MKKLTIIKGIDKHEMFIDNVKYVIGNNDKQKIELLRCLYEFSQSLPESEFSKINQDSVVVKLDDKEILGKKTNIIFINSYTQLNQEMKLQTKSILLKSLIAELENEEYRDIFLSLQQSIESLCMMFNEDKEFKIRSQNFTPALLMKLIEPVLVIVEEQMNEYNLSSDKYIALLLRMIRPAVNSETFNIVIVDYPLITKEIASEISKFENSVVIVFCNQLEEFSKLNEFYLLDKYSIDLANEEALYDFICCNVLHISDMKAGEKYMEEKIKKKNLVKKE